MKKAYIIMISIFIYGNCSSGNSNDPNGGIPLYENALTLVLSFGDDNLPDDYLLAKPGGIAVKSNGDILTTDEYYVKMYDANGNPKDIFGGQGQGPGEFEAPMNPTVSPTDYVTAMNILWEFNVYAPDNSFLEKTRIGNDPKLLAHSRREELNFTMMEDIYSLDESRRVIGLFGQNMIVEGNFPVFKYILYIEPDTLVELVKYHSHGHIKQNNGSSSIDYQGDLEWGFLSDNQIVYTETHYDKSETENGHQYFLFTLSLDDKKIENIAIEYNSIRIPGNLKVTENQDKRSILNDTEFFPPFMELRTDGNMVFAFMYNIKNEENDQREDEEDENGDDIVVPEDEWEPYLVDVINAGTGKLVSKATFKFIPDIIKNGYAYRLLKPNDEFPTIEKYRINPAVYGPR